MLGAAVTELGVFKSHVHGHLLLPGAPAGSGAALSSPAGSPSPWPREGWTRRAASLALSLNPSSQGGQACRPHWSLHPSERPCPPASTRVGCTRWHLDGLLLL